MMDYSKNDRVEKIVGKRPEGGMAVDLPRELGYICPRCKERGENLTWSEYNNFLYCFTCDLDIPSCLCMPDLKEATDIFLSSIQDGCSFGRS